MKTLLAATAATTALILIAAPAFAQDGGVAAPPITEIAETRQPSPASPNFADIAARMNPAVVNIDATARSRRARQLIEEGGRRDGRDRANHSGRGAAPARAS